jgi:oligopeptide/dipeptide ABC transporter ATP-binding protein
MTGDPVLVVEDLEITVDTPEGSCVAVTGVNLTVERGEAVGLVGESGSGKSLVLKSIMGLLPTGARITAGSVRFHGRDISGAPAKELDKLRGSGISMVFQEALTALNPVMPVGKQIVDGAARHRGLNRKQAYDRAIELMALMGIPDPERRYHALPHELSGGMRQRVMIAAALAGEPELLLCDEPTTALDVTVQGQIIALLTGLRAKLHTSLLFVTHDLAVVGELCDRVEVMYSGQIMESGTVREVFDHPAHPYSLGLLRATPRIELPDERLVPIPGSAPSLHSRPPGCPFNTRCAFADDACGIAMVTAREISTGHLSRCVRPEVCDVSRTAEVIR